MDPSSLKNVADALPQIRLGGEPLDDLSDDFESQQHRKRLIALDISPEYYASFAHSAAGEWALHTDEFRRFTESSNSLIQLYGIPVTARADILQSLWMGAIIAHDRDPSFAIALFQFPRDQDDLACERQTSDDCWRSIESQLQSQRDDGHDDGQRDSRQEVEGVESHPKGSISVLVSKRVGSRFKNLQLIIDGVDECADPETFLKSLQELSDQRGKILRIVLGSHLEVDCSQVSQFFDYNRLFIPSEVPTEDIRAYIEERIIKNPVLRGLHQYTRDKTRAMLLKNAKEMLEWSVLQLDQLEGCPADTKLLKVLKQMPQVLKESFDRMVACIPSKNESAVFTILQWLCQAQRRIRLDEMIEILSFDTSTTAPDLEPKPDPLTILRMCSGLVVPQYTMPEVKLDSASQYMELVAHKEDKDLRIVELRFAHSSVQDQLMSNLRPGMNAKLLKGPANLSIAKCCLAYLSHVSTSDASKEDVRSKYPLAHYAAQYWAVHLRNALDASDLDEHETKTLTLSAVSALTKDAFLQTWISLCDPDYLIEGLIISTFPMEIASPIYYASITGLLPVVEALISQNVNPNVQGGRFGSPLQVAAYTNNLPMVQYLLSLGADPDFSTNGRYASALHAALSKSHKPIIDLLLSHKARPCSECLYTVIEKKDESLAVSFLSQGATPTDVALLAAINCNYPTTVHALLSHGLAPSPESLQAAEQANNAEIFTLLLDHGAQPHRTTLWSAAANGHDAIVLSLLECEGIKADSESLRRASYAGHASIVRLLVANGAKVDYETLRGASIRNPEMLVRLLGEHEGSIDLEGASKEQYVVIKNLLRDQGLVSEEKPLVEASSRGHRGVVQLLLEYEAEAVKVDLQESLEVASRRGDTEIVDVLLRNGAKADARCLYEATYFGYIDAMRLLLEDGGVRKDLEALQAALERACGKYGFDEVVRLLLDHGARADRKVLGTAEEAGDGRIVRLLRMNAMEHGVDLGESKEEKRMEEERSRVSLKRDEYLEGDFENAVEMPA
ncbi:hypothetical protein MMC25_005096 [Agyrium rufum]|nr:hypothetical protein [Agyrium rufum]